MKYLMYLALGATVLFTACAEEEHEENIEEEATMKATPIELEAVEGSPEFDGATIKVKDVKSEPAGDEVKLTFTFDVKDYELKNQTSDADAKMCANSAKGQHIHFIMDNEPYAALYEPTHEVTLPKNSEHHLLVFLSRSYHESVKSEGASDLYSFKIDENGKVQKMDSPKEPLLFYSRPKGDYVGENEISNLLLDFYVWNGKLGKKDLNVLANIKANGVDTTMTIKDWQPYFLRNMPTGTPSITLKLVDKDGNVINSPMAEVTREFTLSDEEPLNE